MKEKSESIPAESSGSMGDTEEKEMKERAPEGKKRKEEMATGSNKLGGTNENEVSTKREEDISRIRDRRESDVNNINNNVNKAPNNNTITEEIETPTPIPTKPMKRPKSKDIIIPRENKRESKTPNPNESEESEWTPINPTFWHSTGESFFMIFLAELGDRTFILIAIFAMKYGTSLIMLPCVIFLILLHCVSVFIGLLFPFLFSPVFIAYLSFIVFTVFGGYMFWEAYGMSDGQETPQHIQSIGKGANTSTNTSAINNIRNPTPGIIDDLEDPLLGEESRVEHQLHISGSIEHMLVDDANNYKIVITVLTAVFLAEWGDRSQLGAIVLTATRNMMGVIIGGGIAIGLCAALAAYAGQFLTNYVSVKHLTYVGAALFLFFAFESLFL